MIFINISAMNCYAQNISSYEIIGKWEIVKVTENDQDISSSIDNNAQRWIEFIGDDRYESDGYPFGRYEGEYLLDEKSGLLVLKSGTTNTKIIKWQIGYDGEYLILKGTSQLQPYKFFLKKAF
jgi:hypothetical protein